MTSNMLISFDEEPFFSTASSQQRAVSPTSSFGSLPTMDPVFDHPQELTTDVQLEVSGNSFVLNTRDFQKLAALPWQRIHGGAFRLEGTSPEAFEKCLDYVQNSTLPKRKRMTTPEKEELMSLARTLNLGELHNHMSSKRRSGSPKAYMRPNGAMAPAPRKQSLFSALFCNGRTGSTSVEQAYGCK